MWALPRAKRKKNPWEGAIVLALDGRVRVVNVLERIFRLPGLVHDRRR